MGDKIEALLQKMKEARKLADELALEKNLDVKIEMTFSSLSGSPTYYVLRF